MTATDILDSRRVDVRTRRHDQRFADVMRSGGSIVVDLADDLADRSSRTVLPAGYEREAIRAAVDYAPAENITVPADLEQLLDDELDAL